MSRKILVIAHCVDGKSGYAFEYMAVQSQNDVTVSQIAEVMAITKLYSNKIRVVRAKIENNMPIETIREVVEQINQPFSVTPDNCGCLCFEIR